VLTNPVNSRIVGNPEIITKILFAGKAGAILEEHV